MTVAWAGAAGAGRLAVHACPEQILRARTEVSGHDAGRLQRSLANWLYGLIRVVRE